MNSYKYIYQNPLRAGICGRVEDYRYSTIRGLCGLGQLTIPIEEDLLLFDPEFDESTLNWLNTRADPEHERELKLALRRPEFKLTTSRKTGKRSDLETVLI